MKALHKIAFVLLLIGGLNWGLVGVGGFMGSDWNIVHMILGSWPSVEWAVYILVGVSAILEIVNHKSLCRNCAPMGGQM